MKPQFLEDKKKWRIESAEHIPQTTKMIAIGQQNNKIFNFFIRPSPGSRITEFVAHSQIPEIEEMTFASNDHILVKFKFGTFVTFKSDGTVIEQSEEVQSYLNYKTKILSQSFI